MNDLQRAFAVRGIYISGFVEQYVCDVTSCSLVQRA